MSAPAGIGPRRILVVDDDRDLCDMLAHALRRAGCAVAVCGSAADAVRSARELRPDGFVVDVVLPDSDGLDLCRQLRQDPAHARAAMLVITGRCTVAELSELRRRVREAGADDFLLKPFRLGELVARLRALLETGGPGVAGGAEAGESG